MPHVFLSYPSAQQAVAQQLETELTAKGVNAWRDKTNLHAGERWPKALGDAIADSDALILLWSTEAEQSDFVELEWNIAVAMKKPVMPCLLDATPLPATLKPSHRISGNDMPKTADHILSALKEQPPVSVPTQQTQLLNTLTTVPAAESKQVLRQIKTISSTKTIGRLRAMSIRRTGTFILDPVPITPKNQRLTNSIPGLKWWD